MKFDEYREILESDSIKAPSNLKQKTLALMKIEQAKYKRITRNVMRAVMVATVFVIISTITVFAVEAFTAIDGNKLKFNSSYNDNGIISITVENNSEKPIKFEEKFKLKKWSTGEDIGKIAGTSVKMTGLYCKARNKTIITLDISKAYDISELEKPMQDDGYYLVLTNNGFLHGQDWQCSVQFSEPIISKPQQTPPPKSDTAIVEQIEKSLKSYFEKTPSSIDEQINVNNNYIDAYEKLLSKTNSKVVESVIPKNLIIDTKENVIFDKNVSLEDQCILWGEHFDNQDTKQKYLATKNEKALSISAMLPIKKYKDSFSALPLFYVLTYEKNDITSKENCVLIYGKLCTFDKLEKNKIYEDEKYVSYEISSYIYSDLDSYINEYVKQNPNIKYDEQIYERIKNIYNYFNDNISDLFLYRAVK